MSTKKDEVGKGSEKAPAKQGRALMPGVAAIVDEFRQAYGAERVDAAIAAGQRARREYQALLEVRGETGRDD